MISMKSLFFGEKYTIPLHSTSSSSHFQWTKTVYTDIAEWRLKWGYSISWQAGHFLLAHKCLSFPAINKRAKDTTEQSSCLYDAIFLSNLRKGVFQPRMTTDAMVVMCDKIGDVMIFRQYSRMFSNVLKGRILQATTNL